MNSLIDFTYNNNNMQKIETTKVIVKTNTIFNNRTDILSPSHNT